MSNIADGIEYALQQSRAAREGTKTAAISTPDAETRPLGVGLMGQEIKQAAQVLLAADDEDVTVGDLQALMQEFQ
jgi:hypothetical protein